MGEIKKAQREGELCKMSKTVQPYLRTSVHLQKYTKQMAMYPLCFITSAHAIKCKQFSVISAHARDV